VGSACPVRGGGDGGQLAREQGPEPLEHRRRVARRGERAVQDLVAAGGVYRPGGADQPVGQVLVRGRVHRRGPHRHRQRQVPGVVEPRRHRERDVQVPPAARSLITITRPPATRTRSVTAAASRRTASVPAREASRSMTSTRVSPAAE